MEQGQDADLKLICLWIGFNGIYGQWDAERKEPLADRQSWRRFLDRLLALDAGQRLSAMLLDQRDLVMSILDDEFLSSYFWEDPGDLRAGKSRKAKYDARTWYLENKWRMVLDRLVERIYLLRCQLVHGAATFGGKLNRKSLDQCIRMMRHLLDAALLIIIDDGADEDWGTMCYPPIGAGKPSI